MKVLCISHYPPVEGIASGENPITSAIARFTDSSEVELHWIFPSDSVPSSRGSLNWAPLLAERGVNFTTVVGESTRRHSVFLRTLLAQWPLSATRAHERWNAAIARAASPIIDAWRPDILHFSSPVAAIIGRSLSGIRTRTYTPLDSLTMGLERRTLGERRGFKDIVRAKFQSKMDLDLYAGMDALSFVAPDDAEYARRFFRGPISVTPLGCDNDRFRSSRAVPISRSPLIVFVGAPDYFPNAEAIRVLLSKVLPAAQAKIPNVRLRLIGRGMSNFVDTIVTDRAALDVHEYVADLGAVLAGAWLAAYPLLAGSGMKNKVLDALTCGIPVIGLPEAFSGLSGTQGTVCCRDTDELIAECVALLSSPERLYRLRLAASDSAEKRDVRNIAVQYAAFWRDAIQTRS